MVVKALKTDNGYIYTLGKGSKRLRILFAGNLDLYWSYVDLKDKLDSYGNFVINRKDGLVYRLLDEVYEKIKNADPYDPEIKYNPVGDVYATIFDFARYDMYKELFDGEKITWISDDRDLENDSLVQISKRENSFLLEFAKRAKKDKDKEYYLPDYSKGINVRFRNSGSHYDPFNCVFMKMYNSLGGYTTEFGQMPANDLNQVPGQISIEEHVFALKK